MKLSKKQIKSTFNDEGVAKEIFSDPTLKPPLNPKNEIGDKATPDPIVDEREYQAIEELTNQYAKMTSPNALTRAGKKISEYAPEQIKDAAGKAKSVAQEALDGLTEQEFIAQAIKVAGEGFGELEKRLAKATIDEDYVLKQINTTLHTEDISSLREICLLRSYDIAAVVEKEHLQHLGLALAEGGGTGAVGFWGLPANLALSMLLYFRAVQSVAIFYGYDVKNDPSELEIAGEVFSTAISPNSKTNGASEEVRKILFYAQAESVKKAANKTWAAMIQSGGAGLTIAQIRALASASAKKALDKAGKKGLESSVFTKALEQIGSKLALKNVTRFIPVVGAGFGALFDTAQMSRVLKCANIFYQKRFILEKEQRVKALLERSQFPQETKNKF